MWDFPDTIKVKKKCEKKGCNERTLFMDSMFIVIWEGGDAGSVKVLDCIKIFIVKLVLNF